MKQLKAVFFDQDGTIIDTERDGHRVAFNRAFAEFELPVDWSVETYHELLKIAGGKERLRHFFNTAGSSLPLQNRDREELISALHKRKTDILVDMLQRGELPLRPGIKRLMKEAQAQEIRIGICTTSNPRTTQTIAATMLSEINIELILAGDIVKRKKPDPEIYLTALQKTGLSPEECCVIEDSRNGVRAGADAGIPVVATVNEYTEREDLSEARMVLSCLGDCDGEKAAVQKGRLPPDFNGILTIDIINDWVIGRTD